MGRARQMLPDFVACALLIGVAGYGLARAGQPALAGEPWWANASDAYLFGPDAGEWAMQAVALAGRQLADLDAHRMPTWTLLTVVTAKALGMDVVHAGHLVNKTLFLTLGPAVYSLGRAAGMRAGALAVATLAVIDPSLIAAAARYGVDPTVTTLLPLALFGAWLSGRAWRFAAFGGALAGLLAASHLTALAYPIPAFFLCLLAGKGASRWLSAALFAGGVGATLATIFHFFPFLPDQFLIDAFAEGIRPTAEPTAAQIAASRAGTVALLLKNAPSAFGTAISGVAAAYGPRGVPWTILLVVPILGLWGAAAFQADGAQSRLDRLFSGWATGLPIALASAPLWLFAAGHLPTRYSEAVLPVAGLLMFRGFGFLIAGAARGIGRPKSRLSLGISELALLGIAMFADRVPPPGGAEGGPPEFERRALGIGHALAAHFPPGIGAASPLREALPYAGLRYCPHTVCPSGPAPADMEQCVEVIRRECRGDGPIPFVVSPGLTPEQEGPWRTELNDWIEARFDPVAETDGARIYAIPRTGALPVPGGMPR